jgi:hypothetical protein
MIALVAAVVVAYLVGCVVGSLVVGGGAPAPPPTSRRRLEFEELSEPMTSTTSAFPAMAFTAS